MKVSISVGGYAKDGIDETVQFVQECEQLGVDCVWAAEAWGPDSITALSYLAAKTENIKLGSGILQISARAPAMTAMTALSLNQLSRGRYICGLGVSGPQVVEGLHGVDYAAPLTRLWENVEILRMAFRGEKLVIDGKRHQLPLPGGQGKALRLDHEPADIPIFLATLAPRSLEYTGAAADGWLVTSFSPDHPEAHLAHLRKGAEAAGRTLADIELVTACSLGIGENVEEQIGKRKRSVAFNLGAMGSATTNFYNDAFRRAGYVDDSIAVQELWLAGKRAEAVARVPDEMVTAFSAIGTSDMVKARVQVYRDAGINGLQLRFDTSDMRERLDMIGQLMDMLPD